MRYDPYITGVRIVAQGATDALRLFWEIVKKPWRVYQSCRDFVMRKGKFAVGNE